jgi:uncharacterized membrane protein
MARVIGATGSAPPSGLQMRQAELLISTVLRGGVLTSLAVILAGTLVTFLHHPEYVSSPQELARLTEAGASFPHTLRDVVAGLAALRGQAIVVLGLLILIATPVLRVAVSILVFLEQRDRTYVAITVTVLTLLILSFFLGGAA